eukprot:3216660-Pyramimonas_sp.AAC.1
MGNSLLLHHMCEARARHRQDRLPETRGTGIDHRNVQQARHIQMRSQNPEGSTGQGAVATGPKSLKGSSM